MKARIAELEVDLKQRDRRIATLKAALDEATSLKDDMAEQVKEHAEIIDDWIQVFDMQQDDDGRWLFDVNQVAVWETAAELTEKNNAIIRRWNKFVPKYNAMVRPRDSGRPLAASEDQVLTVRKLRRDGASLRAVVAQTGLGLRTVRTIVEKDQGTDRTADRRKELRRLELDRLRAAEWRSRIRRRGDLEKRVTRHRKRVDDLLKASKGIGHR